MPDAPAPLPFDVADALRRHFFWWPNHSSIGSNAHCACGKRPRDWSHWADHMADVLTSLPGIAIVSLPEQMPMEDRGVVASWLQHQPMWALNDAWANVNDDDDGIDLEADGQELYGNLKTAQAARDLAAVLLAAAAEMDTINA